MNIIIITIAIFLLGSLSIFFIKNNKKINLLSVSIASLTVFLLLFNTMPILFGFNERWYTNFFLVDHFSAMMIFLISIIYFFTTLVSTRYITHELNGNSINIKDVKIYFSLLHLFALCMVVTVIANNVLFLWIALEGTTLTSTFLVGLYKRKKSIEAAWKYIIICSTGISLGLIGILLMIYGVGNKDMDIFTLTELSKYATFISADIIKLSFVFIFIGFGVKVGFAPLHTWLPDAHGNAPSPVSAIFSGILLNVALYVIIRFKFISDIGLGTTEWTNKMFLFFGIFSIIISALMILIQNNYKRMLAYSSVEHMGIISFAISLSPLGLFASIIHMIGHTFTKSMLFFGAGEILLENKTTKIEKIYNLGKYFPYTSGLFLLGILAIIAFPPSAIFVSEYTMFVSSFVDHPIFSIVILLFLSIIAFSMLSSTIKMFSNREDIKNDKGIEKWNIVHTIMTMQFMFLIIFGFYVSSENGLKFIDSITRDILYINGK